MYPGSNSDTVHAVSGTQFSCLTVLFIFCMYSCITVESGMEDMPSQNMPVHRLKLATIRLDLPCSGLVTHKGEI